MNPAEVSELAVLWASQGGVALRRGIISCIIARMPRPGNGSEIRMTHDVATFCYGMVTLAGYAANPQLNGRGTMNDLRLFGAEGHELGKISTEWYEACGLAEEVLAGDTLAIQVMESVAE